MELNLKRAKIIPCKGADERGQGWREGKTTCTHERALGYASTNDITEGP